MLLKVSENPIIKKLRFFKVILKKTPVSKKKLKKPEVALMLHFNYQIKISARICNPKKKLVLGVIFKNSNFLSYFKVTY
jgi:hypothetical protein